MDCKSNSPRSDESDSRRFRSFSRVVSSALLLTSLNPRKSIKAVNCSSYFGSIFICLLERDPSFDLAQLCQILPPVVQLGGSRIGMIGHLLRRFDRATVAQE